MAEPILDNDFGFTMQPEIGAPIPEAPVKPYTPDTDVKDLTKPGAIEIPSPDAGLSEADAYKLIDDYQATPVAESLSVRTKSQKYGAGMDHHQFERYYNMPRVFNKLGFSPFRDNEKLYNEESNWADEVGRASGQWANLTGLGFKDALTFGSLTDTKTARQYEKAMAIGSSSKGGVGGFTTNLYMNSGYTVGILAEATLEELGLALITGASMGSAAPLSIPEMIAAGLKAGNKITKSFEVGKNLLRTLENLKDINKARKYFTEAVKGTGQFLNPLENTVDFARGISKVEGLKNVAKTTLGFTNFYKDVRNVRLSWGESGLEGGMVRNDMESKLLQEHLDTHDGAAPTKKQGEDIRDAALRAGMTTGWQNVGAIYFSNKIVFDGLFNAYKPIKDISMDVLEHGPYKMLFNKKLAKPHEVIEKNWKGFVKTIKDPKSYAKSGLSYFKANLAEGLQETAQEVIGGTNTDYYTNEWRGTALKGGYYASITDNLYNQVSPEGLDVFMSGFLMGGMIAPVASTMGSLMPGSKQNSYLKTTYQKFFNPEQYNALKADQLEYMEKTANKLNKLWENVGDALAPDLENLVKQDEYTNGMAEAMADGNKKAYHDLKDMGYFEHIRHALEKGRFDTFIERLQDQKNLSPEDIKETGLTQEQYTSAIDNAVQRAEVIKSLYEVQEDNFKNPFNPHQFGEGERKEREKKNYKGWQKAQDKFLFANYSFQRTLERMQLIKNEAQKSSKLGKVSAGEFDTMHSISDMDAEVTRLNTEIGSLEGATGDQKKYLADKVKKRDGLEAFLTDMMNVKTITKDMPKKEADALLKAARKSYGKYLRYHADKSKDHAFNNALDKSFQELVDYYELDEESKALSQAVNTLLDPGNFTRLAAMESELETHRDTMAEDERRESLRKYIQEVKGGNDLMQLIYADIDDKETGIKKKPMFFDPDEFEALVKEGILPSVLYYANDDPNMKLVPVDKSSNDWDQAMNIIKEYVPKIMGIPINEISALRAQRELNFNTETRAKSVEDVRTFDDLAKQFGFNKDLTKETVVPLKQVLNAIINSEEATVQEVELASQLLKQATDSETVTFAKAGIGAQYGTTRQTVVDPRFGSSNFEQGGQPLEYLILHAEIQRRVQGALVEDEEFKTKLQNIQFAVRKYFEEHSAAGEVPPAGLGSTEDFISEAMTNSKFQDLMSKVSYDVAGSTTWKGFVQSLMALFKKAFGKNGTALNAAFNIITTKIDSTIPTGKPGKTIKETTKKAAATTENTVVTKRTPMADIENLPTVQDKDGNDYNLATKLLDYYKSYNKNMVDKGEGAFDENYDTRSDAEMIDSEAFDSFISSPIPSIQAIFDTYNNLAGRTVATTPKPIKTGTTAIMTTAMKEWLVSNGFDPKDYNVAQAQALIEQNMSAADLADAEAQAQADRTVTVEAEQIAVRKKITDLINGADTINKLDTEIMDSIDQILASIDEGIGLSGSELAAWTWEDIGKLIDVKKDELAFSYTFDEIKPGMVVIMKGSTENKDGAKMVIDKISGNTIEAHLESDSKKFRKIYRASVQKSIKYIFKKDMMNPSVKAPTEKVTPEDGAVSNKSDKAATDSATKDVVKKAWKSAKKKPIDPNKC